MAKRVLSMICLSVSAGSSNWCGSSPSAITGKSSRGSVARLNLARPAMIVIRPSAAESETCAPSGSLRTISNKVCAETVVAPATSTAALTCSLIWRSRSVAINFSVPLAAASISTLERIGMVLRRSTTDWTWLSPLSKVARSIVAFISSPRTGAPLIHRAAFLVGRFLSFLKHKKGRGKRPDPRSAGAAFPASAEDYGREGSGLPATVMPDLFRHPPRCFPGMGKVWRHGGPRNKSGVTGGASLVARSGSRRRPRLDADRYRSRNYWCCRRRDIRSGRRRNSNSDIRSWRKCAGTAPSPRRCRRGSHPD